MQRYLAASIGSAHALDRPRWDRLDADTRRVSQAESSRAWGLWGRANAAASLPLPGQPDGGS